MFIYTKVCCLLVFLLFEALLIPNLLSARSDLGFSLGLLNLLVLPPIVWFSLKNILKSIKGKFTNAN